MSHPVLTSAALAGLRARDEAGMRQRVTLSTFSEIQLPGGRIVRSWLAEDEQPGRATPLPLNSPLRAAQPSSARNWELSIRAGSPIAEGQQAMIRDVDEDGLPWQRLLVVNEVIPKRLEVRRRAICSDVDTNQ